MTYDQALAIYRQTNPGAEVDTVAGQQAFNDWSGRTFGPGGFEGAAAPATPNNPVPGVTIPGTTNPTAVNIFGTVDPSTALSQAISGATMNPNTQQVQGGQQAGYYQSAGGTTTTGTQAEQGRQESTTTGRQAGTQTGIGQVSGVTSGQQTGQTLTGTVGATTQDVTGRGQTAGTTEVLDTLGLGRLLAGQAGAATSADAARQAFLQGLVTQGPQQQQALTAQAVNQALSGPGMFGTGEGAKARAAGNAAAQVGVNSLNQQLQAAQLLGGPTATTTLVGAGTPYLGQQTTGTTQQAQSTTGTQAGQTQTAQMAEQSGASEQKTGTQQTTDQTSTSQALNLSNLLRSSQAASNEAQMGTSGNVGYTAGIGTVPQNTQTSSGGCYVCTMYVDHGWKAHRMVRKAAQFKLSLPKYRRSLVGYSVYGPTLAKWVGASPTFAAAFFPVARAVLYEELRLAGVVEAKQPFASLCHFVFHYGSLAIAVLTGKRQVVQCDQETCNMLSRNNLLIKV